MVRLYFLDSTAESFLDTVKLDNISKIHTEKKRLSEEELEEERRSADSLYQILVFTCKLTRMCWGFVYFAKSAHRA